MSIRTADLLMPFPTRGDNVWQTQAMERFSRVYPSLKAPHHAAGLVRQNQLAIDYFEQAPCLLNLADQAQCVVAIVENKPLKVILALAGGARVLRRLKGTAVIGVAPSILRRLAKLNPSVVAQSIPENAPRQRAFLLAAGHGLSIDPGGRLDRTAWDEWFVSRVAPTPEHIHTICDFLLRSQRPFDLRWSLEEAAAAADRWHADLGRMSAEERFFQRHGIGFQDDVDYGDFPNEHAHGDFTFVALRSGAALFEDGRAMHHCVGSYSPDVISGKSRIYSVRKGAKRVATLEFSRLGKYWSIRQLCGPCNARPGPAATRASEDFLLSVHRGGRKGIAA